MKKPEFLKEIEDQEVKEGQHVKFRTKVKGYPLPRVVWYKDGHLLKNGTNYKIGKNNIIYSSYHHMKFDLSLKMIIFLGNFGYLIHFHWFYFYRKVWKQRLPIECGICNSWGWCGVLGCCQKCCRGDKINSPADSPIQRIRYVSGKLKSHLWRVDKYNFLVNKKMVIRINFSWEVGEYFEQIVFGGGRGMEKYFKFCLYLFFYSPLKLVWFSSTE